MGRRSLWGPHGRPEITVPVLVVTSLALLDTAVPGSIAGTLCIGSLLAARWAGPRATLTVGGYAAALIILLHLRDPTFPVAAMAVDLVAAVATALVGAVLAGRRQSLEWSLKGITRRQTHLAAVVDSCAYGIIGVDLGGVVRSWNAAAERLTERSFADVIGTRLVGLGSPAAGPSVADALDRLTRTDSGVSRDLVRVGPTGSERYLSVVWSPVRSASGQLIGASLVVRDVSDREREGRSLRDRIEKFERLDSLGRAVGGIAHDFNNLLSVVLGYTGFVEESIQGNRAAQTDLGHVRAAAERAVELTRELLDFAKSGDRGPTGETELVDVDEVVTRLRPLLELTAGTDVRLAVERSPLPTPVQVSGSRLERVLVNLTANARDAMPAGGTLTIRIRTVTLADSHSGANPPQEGGRYVLVRASDTGVGMSPDVAEHIFEPFFTTRGPTGGTGLGLASVWGVVTDAGGYLRVFSAPGAGTTFDIYLPLAQLESQSPIRPAGPHDPPIDTRSPATPVASGRAVRT